MTIQIGEEFTLDGIRLTVTGTRGTSGEVFEVKTDTFGDAILKIGVKPSDSTKQRMYQKEVTILKKLSENPHVVNIFRSGEESGFLWMILERLERRKTREQLTTEHYLRGLADVCAALETAHEMGIVHRDLDPANMLMSGDSWKVIDWGAAFFRDDPIDWNELIPYRTVSVSAPETSTTVNDPRIDLYSIGCCLFFFLTGRMPYGEGPRTDVINRHLNNPVPQISDDAASNNSQLKALLNRLMAKNPDDRIQHASELRRCLLDIADNGVLNGN